MTVLRRLDAVLEPSKQAVLDKGSNPLGRVGEGPANGGFRTTKRAGYDGFKGGVVGIGTGFALVAVGAILVFTFTGEMFGVDVDVLGVILMIAGALVLALGLFRGLRARGSRQD